MSENKAKQAKPSNVRLVPEDIKKQLKEEYGDKLRSILVPKDDYGLEEIEVMVVVPSRSTSSQAMKFGQHDPGKGWDILIKNCLLTNKEEVINDDALFMTVASAITELLPVRQGKSRRV